MAAWTTPRTANVGDTYTAAWYNQHTRDNLQYLYDNAGTGWIPADETWTYASADSPTFTFTISGDKTAKYQAGQRIKLTQTTAKYFIVTAVSYSAPNTTVTVYGGTDYTLANAAITSPYYSPAKAPIGFPTDPTKWRVTLTDTGDRSQATPVSNTWYNPGSLSLTIPIGAWHTRFEAPVYFDVNAGGDGKIYAALSTANNSASDSELRAFLDFNLSGANMDHAGVLLSRRKTLVLTVKTPYYLNTMVTTSGTTTALGFYASTFTTSTVVVADCAYL